MKYWFWNHVRFPLSHPREWLCDRGFLCAKHHAQYAADSETLSEIADIVDQIPRTALCGIEVATALAEIKKATQS